MKKIPLCGMLLSSCLMGDKIRIKARLNLSTGVSELCSLTFIKAGNPSIVFDCIYNPSIKSRTLRDPDFKLFIIGPFF